MTQEEEGAIYDKKVENRPRRGLYMEIALVLRRRIDHIYCFFSFSFSLNGHQKMMIVLQRTNITFWGDDDGLQYLQST